MARFATLDNRRLSFANCWHASPVSAPFLWLLTLLRIRVPLAGPQFLPESLADMECNAVDLSAAARDKLLPKIEEARALGFTQPEFRRLQNPFDTNDSGGLSMVHVDGSSVYQCCWVRVNAGSTTEKTSQGFSSKLQNGTWVTTGNSGGFGPLPWERRAKSSTSVEKMWSLHQRRLAEKSAQSPHVSLHDRRALVTFYEELEVGPTQHLFDKGAYELLPDVNIEKMRVAAQTVAAHPGGLSANAHGHVAVLQELHKLQAGGKSLKRNLGLLAVTGALFFLAGMRSWSLNDLLLLVGVLLFHELGHFIAMRVCGYRNLQMFFIPFFGAAVTGRHLAPAGWKKALVSLMGPLPGILVGVALTIVAMVTWDMRFIPLAAMLLLLNGLNLVPLMPLDGGWFFHAVLFGRNRWSEAAFRGITGVLLIGAALAMGAKLLVVVGIFIVISCVSAWHAANVAERLRDQIAPPLDGGWFFHAVLFGRNRWSEAAFRGITGVLLIGAALAMAADCDAEGEKRLRIRRADAAGFRQNSRASAGCFRLPRAHRRLRCDARRGAAVWRGGDRAENRAGADEASLPARDD